MAKKTTSKSTKKAKQEVKATTHSKVKGVAEANPGAAMATTYSVGVLHTGSIQNFGQLVGFMQTAASKYLRDEKQSNDSIDFFAYGRYADNDTGLLEDYADELVNETTVPVIVAAGGPQSAIAAMDATVQADSNTRKDVPIVFTTVADPVLLGLVDDPQTPGRNLTGMAGKTSETDPDRLKLLAAYISPQRPQARKVGVLINPVRPAHRKHLRKLKQVARNLSPSLKVVARRANNESGIKRAFQAFSGVDFIGAIVTADSYFNNNRAMVIEAAKNNGVPAIYQWRAFAEDGGLMSFGPSIKAAYEEAGRYVARILPPEPREDPAEMECSKPDPLSFELVVKKSTALALGLNLPPATLLGKQVNQIP